MIRATANTDGALFTLDASVNGAVVYLDNWAIGDLAEGDPWRRRRFLDAMHSGMDLLFSVTNATELWGPQGRSAEAVEAFLDEIGPRWFPGKLDPTELIKGEQRGESQGTACVDEMFLKSYVADLMRSAKVICLSEDFFRLGPIVGRMGSQRESLSISSAQFDEALKSEMSEARENSKRDPEWLDKKFPRIPFNPARPAFFVYLNLLRTMAFEANSLKKGDGLDFCHTVLACAYASFAALDKQWKRRAASLPTPNGIARLYSQPELDEMVTDMESWVTAKGP